MCMLGILNECKRGEGGCANALALCGWVEFPDANWQITKGLLTKAPRWQCKARMSILTNRSAKIIND